VDRNDDIGPTARCQFFTHGLSDFYELEGSDGLPYLARLCRHRAFRVAGPRGFARGARAGDMVRERLPSQSQGRAHSTSAMVARSSAPAFLTIDRVAARMLRFPRMQELRQRIRRRLARRRVRRSVSRHDAKA
jgi:hypothetical protein